MARTVVPDLTVHIVQRGHDRGDCFFEESDYRTYLDHLAEFAAKFSCSVHAYCLMTNHVHLLVTPHAPDSCAQMMKNIGQRHVQRINRRRQRSGTLWEGRFFSCPVTTERYVLACYRYIELNPPRAGMVGHASEYPWSSFRENAKGDPSGLVTPHAVYVPLLRTRNVEPGHTVNCATCRLIWDHSMRSARQRAEAMRSARPASRAVGRGPR